MSPTTPGVGGRDPVVLQLDASFAHLRVERAEVRLRGVEIVLRRVELVLADRAGLEQRLQPLDLALPVGARPPRAPVRCDSVLRTVAASCSGSICTQRRAGADLTSPDFTKIFVTRPSTCGWMVVEFSERTVEMNSDDNSIGFVCERQDGHAGGAAASGARRRRRAPAPHQPARPAGRTKAE